MALAPLSDLNKEQIQYLQGKITLKKMSKDVLTKMFISAPQKNNYWCSRDGALINVYIMDSVNQASKS